ncbi:larval cuticle protein LCP-22 [Manduca sexta]|uniref:Uncharacterized protein n=1 Tax=Manduca sexta TaxID=7130 RepID=A0A922CJI1_MANSE|nr:larval cuticle protein LCP-22 [Manduca sexta]KAG6447917.1 hypothetical protein O3G_MSEX005279 [Manduca sexta]KAG6447918.1 hypothetical protein O3G_MSEX005279 [Manduca sexta]
MKFAVAFAAVLAVAAAQFSDFDPSRVQYVRPSPSPVPYRVSTVAPQLANINRVVDSDRNANILRYDNDVGPDGSYSYAYDTSNGISAQEQGVPRDFGGNPPLRPVVAQGSFAYTSPEGVPIAISYIADENGFQPSGDSIPTPPPIPAHVLRSLEYIRLNAPSGSGLK